MRKASVSENEMVPDHDLVQLLHDDLSQSLK